MMLNGKDSFWLQLEVCREYQRARCTRSHDECKFAHPPTNVEVQSNGRVTACYDSMKGRCQRDSCKYMHPPAHLKDQLLINGRNHLALKNALLAQQQSPHAFGGSVGGAEGAVAAAAAAAAAAATNQHQHQQNQNQTQNQASQKQHQNQQQQQRAALFQSALAQRFGPGSLASLAGQLHQQQQQAPPVAQPGDQFALPTAPSHAAAAAAVAAAAAAASGSSLAHLKAPSAANYHDLQMKANPMAAIAAAAIVATQMNPFMNPSAFNPSYASQYAAAMAAAAAAASAQHQQHQQQQHHHQHHQHQIQHQPHLVAQSNSAYKALGGSDFAAAGASTRKQPAGSLKSSSPGSSSSSSSSSVSSSASSASVSPPSGGQLQQESETNDSQPAELARAATSAAELPNGLETIEIGTNCDNIEPKQLAEAPPPPPPPQQTGDSDRAATAAASSCVENVADTTTTTGNKRKATGDDNEAGCSPELACQASKRARQDTLVAVASSPPASPSKSSSPGQVGQEQPSSQTQQQHQHQQAPDPASVSASASVSGQATALARPASAGNDEATFVAQFGSHTTPSWSPSDSRPAARREPGAAVAPASGVKGLRLEICREYMRNACKRQESNCRFVHPSKPLAVPPHQHQHQHQQDGQPATSSGAASAAAAAYVIVCMDFMKGRCMRTSQRCRYLHPASHLQSRLSSQVRANKPNLVGQQQQQQQQQQ